MTLHLEHLILQISFMFEIDSCYCWLCLVPRFKKQNTRRKVLWAHEDKDLETLSLRKFECVLGK